MPHYVQKLRAAVRITMPGQEAVPGFFSLLPQAEEHEGPETVLDRLNCGDRVIPFERENGAMFLLTRTDIERVSAGAGMADGLLLRAFLVTHEERILVRFRSGAEMAGTVQMELPEHLNRASDFLNCGEDYFPLISGREVALVNKAQVQSVRVYQSSPLPIEANGIDARR